MPKKKQQRNAFYWFMQELMPTLQREGRVFPNGMQDVVPLALPRWKDLPPAEKERFEKKAKDEKKRVKGTAGDRNKLDNVGNILAERVDPRETSEKRRMKDKKIARSRWPEGDEILTYRFYFISFQVLCRTEEGDYLPCEIGMTEFSLKEGITNTFHRFIDPGPIPTGYRFKCMQESEETHKIPVSGFELADNNYRGLIIQIQNFINRDGAKKEYPPVYCLESEHEMVEYCLHWIHTNGIVGGPCRIQKIYAAEDLAIDLFARTQYQISEASAIDILTTSNYDYEPNTTCKWHEEIESNSCALYNCKRYVFALVDPLSKHFGFELTQNHLPSRTEPSSAIPVSPSAITMDSRPIQNYTTRGSYNSGRFASDSSSYDTGPFGGRDYRFRENSPEREYQSGYIQPSETLRRPAFPGFGAQQASKPALNSQKDFPSLEDPSPAFVQPAPSAPPRQVTQSSSWKPKQEPQSFQNDNDWPTLGGVPRSKYANRAAPPPASVTPQPPKEWQQDHYGDYDEEEDDKFDRKPNLIQIMKEQEGIVKPTLHDYLKETDASQKPTLGQAVAEREKKKLSETLNMTQVAPRGPARGRGWAPGGAGRGSGQWAPPSGGVTKPPMATKSATEVGATAVKSSSPFANSICAQQNLPSSGGNPQAGGSAMRGVKPALTGGTGDNVVSQTQQQISNMFIGAGRGRGVWNPSGRGVTTVNSSNQSITRPPPGFGRGMVNKNS